MAWGRAGGALAVGLSLILLVMVLARDVGLNPLNGWTIFLGLAAGGAAFLRPSRGVFAAAAAVVVMAMAPATIAGVGFLYLPAIALLLAGFMAKPDSLTQE